MTSRFTLIFIVCLGGMLPSLPGQNLVGDIEQAHGGAGKILQAESYQVQGSLTRNGQTTRFVLDVQGEASRFEAGDVLVLRQEALVQSLGSDGSWSRVKAGWEGLREIYLLPILSLQQLPARYKFEGTWEGHHDFSQKINRRTHLGYHRKTPKVDLKFDGQKGLLTQALLTTVEQNQSPVLWTYSEYQDFGGLKLPAHVERQAGDTEPWVFVIESIDYSPAFPTDHFDFQ